ncbi:microcystin-dependent protein [Breoghania corrubedonensis]|uniref:Microcystin-dependent protein n=1 Tax=Breoghania corrubedonensis TaxID=665038 RepID=A0A2T5UPX7_9HYPH|nr:tail fiber protein [Breoghania corrubedonensis]PTW53570.1 microcystin-dependent protein [Breoghania corrubedonensis]
MTALFANNAVSTLAAPISAQATALTIQAADAALFPTFSGGGGAGEWFPATIIASTGEIEIVRVTARNGSALTVARAQEGTAARAFVAGAKIELRLTAGTLSEMAGNIAVLSNDLNTATTTLSKASNIAVTASGGIPVGSVQNALEELDTSKTPVGHLHVINDVTGLQDALDTKVNADDLPAGVAVGSIMAFGASEPPAGWLECNGAAVSRKTYAALFAAIGTVFGGGDAASTFNLPDLRGEFVRGWDHGRAVDADRGFGSSQLDAMEAWTASFITRWNYSSDGSQGAASVSDSGTQGATNSNAGARVTIDPSRVARTAKETRPRNIALLYCIKAFDAVTDPAQVAAADVLSDMARISGRVGDVEESIATIVAPIESDEIVVSGTGVYTWAHGLGKVPVLWGAFARWTGDVASGTGYEKGDEVPLNFQPYYSSSWRAGGVWADSTECGFSCNDMSGTAIIGKNGAATDSYLANNPDWVLFFRIWS